MLGRRKAPGGTRRLILSRRRREVNEEIAEKGPSIER
jgi:hypothetical protein